MKSKIIIMLVIGSFLAAAASGCSLLKKRVEKKEKVTYRVTGNNKVKISIENLNGEIKVSKSDDTLGTVTIDAEKISKVKADELDKPLDKIKINIDTAGGEIKITSDITRENSGLFSKSDNSKVNFNIKVPTNIKVEVNNTNGNVTLTNLANDIKVETVNGRTNLVRCSGDIKIDGVNGAVSGNFDSLKSLNIEVVNGSVKLGGLEKVSAQVSVSTIHGKITYKELTIANLVSEKKNISGTIGSGKGIIKISTTNGSVTLSAKDISLSKQLHDTFEALDFQFNFDDDENIVKDKKKDTAKTLEPVKEQVTPKVPDTPKTK